MDEGVNEENWAALIADGFRQFVELASGHREIAKAAGFSDDAAEEMGVEFHRALMEIAVTSQSGR